MEDKTGKNYNFDFTDDQITLKKILTHRNLTHFEGCCADRIMFDSTTCPLDSVYSLLKKYSFRIVLRDIIKYRESFTSRNLTKFASADAVENFLNILSDLKIIKDNKDASYTFQKNSVNSFGDTLEWFTACLMKNEFAAPSGWGIKLNISGVGGDYDVISYMGNHLIFIETKSSPPAHIEQSSVNEFIARVYSLYPDMAVFFVDTHLRMKDKIAPMMEYALRSKGKGCSLTNLNKEIYELNHCLYITNSKPDITANLRIIISDFLRAKSPFND